MTLAGIRFRVMAALTAALISASAYMAIPLGPAPIVLSTVFVLLSGLLFGPRLAAAGVGLYLLVGLLGLPVFSMGRGGIAHFLGPTGGFLLGFPPGAAVAGWIASRGGGHGEEHGLGRDVAAVIAGTTCFFLTGLPWMRFHPALDLTWSGTLAVGLLPFLPGAVLKGALVVGIARHLRSAVHRFPEWNGTLP